jgi:hypothetical protein
MIGEGIARELFQCRVSAHRCNLFFGASNFGQALRGGLAQCKKTVFVFDAIEFESMTPRRRCSAYGKLYVSALR